MVKLDVIPVSPSKLPSNLSTIKKPTDSGLSSSSPQPIRWRKGELIGAGAFGRVYMGMNLDSGELLAVKQVLIAANNVARERAQAHVKELEEEVKLLQNLSHPNIVRYLGTAREDDALNIFLEFVPGGSIASLLGKFGSFPESVIQMYTRQLLQGLQYLHKNGIMHRDIKGANILVDNKGCIKLADFGASKQVVELVTLSGAKSMKGTPYWMAPEVIRQTGHSLPADIWSVGCTVIEMATGKPPWSQQYQEVAALFHIGTTKSHPPIPDHLSHEANDFLLKCLKKEPHLRPTATELLQHPFVEQGRRRITVLASVQVPHGIRVSQVSESSKRQHLDAGSALNVVEESRGALNLVEKSRARRSLGFVENYPASKQDFDAVRGSFGPDADCSVRLDCDSLMEKSLKSGVKFSEVIKSAWERSSINPMTSFNPIREPSYVDDSWTDYSETNFQDSAMLRNNIAEAHPSTSERQDYGKGDGKLFQESEMFRNDIAEAHHSRSARQDYGEEDGEFSFHCASADEDDEVTESKIKAFLDEKAMELKKLQTPLYMEYHSIQNVGTVVQQRGDTSSIRNAIQPKVVGQESLISPVSPATRRQLTAPNSRSPSRASSHSGPSIACSRDSDASVSSGSPGGPNRSMTSFLHADSPRLREWRGLLHDTQQLVPSPRNLSPSEQQRLWKEELQKELDMKREEKRMLSRLAGSTKSSPVSKSASPKEGGLRHAMNRPFCASPS